MPSDSRSPSPPVPPQPVVELAAVSVRRAGRTILGPIDLVVRRGERWVLVGPNGAGKTTLAQVATTYLWPTTGRVAVLGRRLGEVDARDLRARIGYAGGGLERAIADELTALDVVMTARHGALGPWWHRYDDADRARAHAMLARLGVERFAATPMGLLSTGERRRVQVARALMPEPDLLVLDEPAAGLDLAGREALVTSLAELARGPDPAAILLVTHHLEEIPPGFGHALVLRDARAVSSGPIRTALASGPLSAAFDLPLHVERRDGRWTARRSPEPAVSAPGSTDGSRAGSRAAPGAGPASGSPVTRPSFAAGSPVTRPSRRRATVDP